MYGGSAAYLVGRAVFLRFGLRTVRPRYLVAPLLVSALLPVAQRLPGLAALGLLAVVLVGLCGFEALISRAREPEEPEPAAVDPAS